MYYLVNTTKEGSFMRRYLYTSIVSLPAFANFFRSRAPLSRYVHDKNDVSTSFNQS